MKKILGMFVIFSLFLSACGSSDSDDEKEKDDKTEEKEQETEVKEEALTSLAQFQETYPDEQPVAILDTNYGKMVIVLFPEYAPNAVENFMTHAKDGYYNGLKFHRVMQDFMIQSGDPLGTGTGGESIWGTPFEAEFSNELYHFKGALAMARAQSLSSQGSQFYIVQSSDTSLNGNTYDKLVDEKYQEVGGASFLDGEYSVFGQTIEGLDVLDKIAAVEVKDSGFGEVSTPVEDVILNSVTITTYGEYK